MKDRYYSENTKSRFTNIESWLFKRGFKIESYGDYTTNGMTCGECQFIKPGILLSAKYQWEKAPDGRGYKAGKMISLEDLTSCYSEILGMKTGY